MLLIKEKEYSLMMRVWERNYQCLLGKQEAPSSKNGNFCE